MRSTTIPAQITTVEDTIAGTLTMKQIVLLINPVMFAILLYMVLPPFFQFSLLKIVIASIYGIFSLVLAIRIKSKLIFDWVQILTTYAMRARYFVYDKNDHFARVQIPVEKKKEEKVVKVEQEVKQAIPSFLGSLENISLHPDFNVIFKPLKKGGMHVAVYKAQE